MANKALRDPIRDEAEIREPIRAEEGERTRLRKGSQVIDPFHIPQALLDDLKARGISVEWKRHEVLGQKDMSEDRNNHDQGWRAAQHDLLPGLFAEKGMTGAIIVKDMILMERPLRLTMEARREDSDKANAAVRLGERNAAEAQIGKMERLRPTIASHVETMPVPD